MKSIIIILILVGNVFANSNTTLEDMKYCGKVDWNDSKYEECFNIVREYNLKKAKKITLKNGIKFNELDYYREITGFYHSEYNNLLIEDIRKEIEESEFPSFQEFIKFKKVPKKLKEKYCTNKNGHLTTHEYDEKNNKCTMHITCPVCYYKSNKLILMAEKNKKDMIKNMSDKELKKWKEEEKQKFLKKENEQTIAEFMLR
jgi:hypothetical protein